MTRAYINRVQNKSVYFEFIANQLRTPSYLSLEYVLQKYSILSESVYAYTSVTPKSKRSYQNVLGTFTYRSMKSDLFTGFGVRKIAEYSIYEATKEKALFDYLYLRFFRKKNIDNAQIYSLRLNLDGFKKQEKKNFKKYCDLTKTKKYKNLPNFIFN